MNLTPFALPPSASPRVVRGDPPSLQKPHRVRQRRPRVRYILRGSKANASLRLTISVAFHVGTNHCNGLLSTRLAWNLSRDALVRLQLYPVEWALIAI
ncbi:hypothetical protein BXZ70DRAFT_1006304 [Cristinia sonorae]|uniref:Uncharacterized protein n=1 Tax=Cristinia sonorae TaxID=1940300 RepID=A0A8K0XS43_9AGAR|nr:hypothetical protein BXZ70DRAFT_1006304 [Cristinia sonorae]